MISTLNNPAVEDYFLKRIFFEAIYGESQIASTSSCLVPFLASMV